jgi:anti-sigma factor RsiW
VGALAAVVLVGVSVLVVRRVSTENTALVAEAVDEHIAALAAGSAPEVVSSDRHTVKPWFQGRLPFSFNLPQALAADTTLDGANLTYVQGEPAAQLLFSIGKHRVSMFVRQRGNAESGLGTSLHDPSASSGQVVGRPLLSDHNGFHVEEIRTTELDMVAVSDVDASRLRELMQAMEAVQ